MNRSIDLGEQATRSLIAADLLFFSDLVQSPRLEPIRPIGMLVLMPFLSAFLVESAAYVELKGLLSVQDLKPHQALLRTSRQRIKHLDDDRRSFAQIVEETSNLAEINSGWFKAGHHGALGPLTRLLQRDLGLFFMHGEVVSTTHVQFLNLGITKEALAASALSLGNLGPYLQDIGEDLGRYVGQLMEALGIEGEVPGLGFGDSVPPIQDRDVKSDRFYGSMARRVAPLRTPVCIMLTSILAQVNTARIFVPIVAGSNDVAAFKIKFVSLFHAASSLQTLLNHDRKERFFHPEAAHQIGAILGTRSVRNVRRHRSLRNTFVHYNIDEPSASRLSSVPPLFGLVEELSSGMPLATVANDIESGLARVSDGLSRLLPEVLAPVKTL